MVNFFIDVYTQVVSVSPDRRFPACRICGVTAQEYSPVDKTSANLLFQLIAKRYEHSSTIITTNQPFNVFSDAVLANSILDRLLHHSHVIKMVGPSYRTKDYYDLLDAEEQKTGQ